MLTVKVNNSILTVTFIEEIQCINFDTDMGDYNNEIENMQSYFWIRMTSGKSHYVSVNINDISEEDKNIVNSMYNSCTEDPRFDRDFLNGIAAILKPYIEYKRNKLISILKSIKEPIQL